MHCVSLNLRISIKGCSYTLARVYLNCNNIFSQLCHPFQNLSIWNLREFVICCKMSQSREMCLNWCICGSSWEILEKFADAEIVENFVDYTGGGPPRFAVNNSERHTCLVWHLKRCGKFFSSYSIFFFRKKRCSPSKMKTIVKRNGVIWIINTHK